MKTEQTKFDAKCRKSSHFEKYFYKNSKNGFPQRLLGEEQNIFLQMKGGIFIERKTIQKGLAVLIVCMAIASFVISLGYHMGIIERMILSMEVCQSFGSANADMAALILTAFLMVFSCIALSLSTIFISQAIRKQNEKKEIKENAVHTK